MRKSEPTGRLAHGVGGLRMALLIVVLTVVAFGMRAWRLDGVSISPAESLTLYRAHLGLPHATQYPLPGAANPYPPLYYVLLAAFARLAGESDFALRFLSLAPALVLVPLLYTAGARFWGRGAGACAALLGALSPLYLRYGREAWTGTLVAALGLVAIYALQRGFDSAHRGWIAAACVASVLAALASYSGFLVPAALALAVVVDGRTSRPDRAAGACILALMAALGVMVLGPGLWTAGPSAAAARAVHGLATLLVEALRAFGPALIVSGPVPWALDLLCLILALLGLLWRPGRSRLAALLAYLVVPLLGLGAASLVRPAYGAAGHLMLLSPAFYLLMGRGLERLGRGRLLPLALVPGLAVTLAMALAAQGYWLSMPASSCQDYRGAARAVQLDERPGDVIVLSAPDEAATFLHYYAGGLPSIALPPLVLTSDRATSDRAAASLARRFDRVWLVTGRGAAASRPGPIAAWLAKNGLLVASDAFPGQGGEVRLQLYLANSPVLARLPACQYRQPVSYGQLRLEGYDLPLRPVSGGQRAYATLYWRAAAAPRDVQVGLGLVDGEGREWGRSRAMPYPAFPPRLWPVGTIMRYQAGLTVPPGVPPGWYTLVLRLYDPQGHPLEPVAGASPGPLPLGPVRVEATWAGPGTLPAPGAGHVLAAGGARFGDALSLQSISLEPREVRPGQRLHADLSWRVEQPPRRDLTLTLELMGGDGQTIASRVASPVSPDCPPGSWEAGEVFWAQHDLLVPRAAQPGWYRLRLSARDAEGRQLPVRDQWKLWTWGQEALLADEVRVSEAPRLTQRPPMQHVLEGWSTAGLELLGYDGAPCRLSPGTETNLTLYWWAEAVPGRSYKASIQLLGPDGQTVLAQDDSIPGGWGRSTADWGVGEVVADRRRLAVPSSVRSRHGQLIVALYDEDSGRRVDWLIEDQPREYLTLCSVEIGG